MSLEYYKKFVLAIDLRVGNSLFSPLKAATDSQP